MIDAHNHFQDPAFIPHRAAILEALTGLGFPRMIVNGTTVDDWPAVAQLAVRHRFVIPSYGLHPWHLDQRPADWETRLCDLLEANPQACVGETGVDRWMQDPDIEAQQTTLQRHLAIAREYRRPITIHCLRAWGELTRALRASPPPASGFLVHAFGGSQEIMKELAGLNGYFSFNPAFLHPKNRRKLAVFKVIPLEGLLVETDAPAMPPPEARMTAHLPEGPDGKPLSHPANIALAYQALADLRGISQEELKTMVAANFARFTGELPR